MVAPSKCIDDQIHSSSVARRIVGGCRDCGYTGHAGDPMRVHGIGCDRRGECAVCGDAINLDESATCGTTDCASLYREMCARKNRQERIANLYTTARGVLRNARRGGLDRTFAMDAIDGYRTTIRTLRGAA